MASDSTPDASTAPESNDSLVPATEGLNVPLEVGTFVRAPDREHEDDEYIWESVAHRTNPGGNPVCGVQVKQTPDGEWAIYVLRWGFDARRLTLLATVSPGFDHRQVAFAVAKDMMEAATKAGQPPTDALLAYKRSLDEADE